ncbi:hypothetical protein C0995_004549 [Termitomyces sp. Mi166|nr:hypothetical protein C0995_004549 [Termitomyces sp. Mi166\
MFPAASLVSMLPVIAIVIVFIPTFLARLAGTLIVLNACVGSLALFPSAHIFPLYIYPGTGCLNWAPLLAAVPAYPDLQFIVVVNPASGPGPAGSQPDANYQNCIVQLRNAGDVNGNVKIIGYVATGFGNRAPSAVTADIDTYSGWADAYYMEGIFFDEAVTDPNSVSKYQSYASYVKTELDPDAYITLNPGTWAEGTSSPDYFSFADLVVTFEDEYKNFVSLHNSTSRFPTGASTPTSKQAAIIHTGPMTAPIGTVQTITQTLRLGASFYSDLPNTIAYNQFPTNWKGYLDELVATQA